MGVCEGSTKSLLCVDIFRATTRGGKGLPGDLVLYEQALQNPIGVSFGASQLSFNVFNRPEAITPCHHLQRLFSELTALLWSHVRHIRCPLQKERVVLLAPLNVPCRAVRAGASCHALQPQKTFGHAGWNRTTSVPLLPLLVS